MPSAIEDATAEIEVGRADVCEETSIIVLDVALSEMFEAVSETYGNGHTLSTLQGLNLTIPSSHRVPP